MSGLALIASSDEFATKKLLQALGSEKWEAHCYRTGREFLNALRSGVIPDFVFLDQDLARVDGVSVLKNFLPVPHDERCPIVFIREEDKGTSERELMQLGVDECLKDAFKVQDAIECLRRLTFLGGEFEVRRLLKESLLQTQDSRLLQIEENSLFYQVEKQKELYLAIAKSYSLQSLGELSHRELKGRISVYRLGKEGMRKVWPRSGRPLVGQLIGA